MTATAKLFMHGRSQAVRLPKEFRFEGTEVRVSKVGDKVMLEPMKSRLLTRRHGSRVSMNSAAATSCRTECRTIRRSSPIRGCSWTNHLPRHQHCNLRHQPALPSCVSASLSNCGWERRSVLPAIALFELRYGHARSNRRAESDRALAEFLAPGIAVLPFDAEDAAHAGDIRAVSREQRYGHWSLRQSHRRAGTTTAVLLW